MLLLVKFSIVIYNPCYANYKDRLLQNNGEKAVVCDPHNVGGALMKLSSDLHVA